MTLNHVMSVSADGRSLLRGGSPFFYTADTPWYGFLRPTDEEWDYYLRYRAEQGFNVLQVSLLPIVHEIAEPDPWSPFAWTSEGAPDLSAFDPEYFARAADRVRRAQEHGFTCAVAVLWANYVPDTWAARRDPRFVLTEEQSSVLLQMTAQALAPYDPILMISGDTDFPAAAVDRFAAALKEAKLLAPRCLTTLHTQPRATVPDTLSAMAELDLHTYQSGHTVGVHEQQVVADAEGYASASVRRPVIDAEPCYEQHGYGHSYGRFTAHDIRRASWTAVLAGASAGIGYGAHGIFQWHRAGQPFAGEGFSSTPYDWREVLHAPGAADVTALRDLVETHGLHGLQARQDLLRDAPEGVRAATTPDGSAVVVYMPWPVALDVDLPDADQWTVRLWSLDDRRRRHPRTTPTAKGLRVDMSSAIADSVVLLTRR